MYSQLLLPLDGSEVSEGALATARNLALSFNARLHLLRVLPLSEELALIREAEYGILGNNASQDLLAEVAAARVAQAEEYLDGIAGPLRAGGVVVTTAREEGPAADRIVEYAEAQGIDLIVMSTHGRGGVRRFLVGSVTDRVIRSTVLPVLVVHPA